MNRLFLLCSLALCAIGSPLLAGCQAPESAGRLGFNARHYYQGKALELARAVDRKDAAAIQRLIKEEGVDPDTLFDGKGMPLVAWPLVTHNLEGLRLLLEAGADPNARHRPVVRDDLPGANNAMVFAAGMEDRRYLELLLDHGGDPNTRTMGDSPLTYAARLSDRWPNVQLLIERGADVNHRMYGNKNNKPIDWYAGLGNFEQVYWLLQHGADPTTAIEAPGFPQDGTLPTLQDIFYKPVQDWARPWQEKCQVWVLERGIKRPPMLEYIRKNREQLGLPTREEDIPLPAYELLPEFAAEPTAVHN